MSGDPSARIERALRIEPVVEKELRRAIAADAVYRDAWFRDDVPAAVSGTDAYMALRVLRNAVLCEFVMTLMRVWDTDKNAASLTSLCAILRDPEVQACLYEQKVQRFKPNGDPARPPNPDQGKRWADRSLARLKGAIETFDRRDSDHVLTGLRTLRDEALAHADMQPRPHGVKYGYPCKLLEQSLRLFDDLVDLLTHTHYAFAEDREIWREHSADFWARVVRGSDKREGV
jgi:hypothetical protein